MVLSSSGAMRIHSEAVSISRGGFRHLRDGMSVNKLTKAGKMPVFRSRHPSREKQSKVTRTTIRQLTIVYKVARERHSKKMKFEQVSEAMKQ